MKKKTLAIILIVLLALTAVYFATSFVVAQLAAPTAAGALLDVHTFFVDQWAFIIDNIVALSVLAVFLVLIVVLALMYLFPKGRSTSGKSYKKPRSRKASK